jgi:hypothetical protein
MSFAAIMNVSRSVISVRADSTSKPPSRRTEIENDRKTLLKRIKSDLRRISDEEKTYSSELIKDIIPVRVSFKTGILDRLKDSIPIKVEIIKKNDGKSVKSVDAEVVSDAELD